MAISDLDAKTALVLIDLQEGLRPMPTNIAPTEIFQRAAVLAQAFRDKGRPVVLVTVEPKQGATPRRSDQARAQAASAPPANASRVVPELDERPDDIRIIKHTWGAFHETALHEKLQTLGVTEIVLAGIATSVGVESTARAAHERNYNVVVVSDVVADRDVAAHENSLSRIFPRLGRVGTANEVLNALGAPS